MVRLPFKFAVAIWAILWRIMCIFCCMLGVEFLYTLQKIIVIRWPYGTPMGLSQVVVWKALFHELDHESGGFIWMSTVFHQRLCMNAV